MNVEWIILADSAEVVNNKLYLMGGGWDALTVTTAFPVVHSCAIAVAFRVPWNETNQKHCFQIEVADQDAAQIAVAGGHFEVGRPAGIPRGQDQRFQFAVTLPLELPKPNSYVVVASIEGQEVERKQFSVIQAPGAAASAKP